MRHSRVSLTTALIAGFAGIVGISALAYARSAQEGVGSASVAVLVIDRMPESAVPILPPEGWKIVAAHEVISAQDIVVYGEFRSFDPHLVGFSPMQGVYHYRPGLTGDWGGLTGTVIHSKATQPKAVFECAVLYAA